MRALKDFGWKKVVRVAAATVIGLGVASMHLAVNHTNAVAAASPVPSETSRTATVAQAASHLKDGVYLYGQTTRPNQLGQSYFVFEVKQGNVLGALYMPQSSFDCARGNFEYQSLALKIRDSYARTAFNYSISLDRTAKVATKNLNGLNPVQLAGFQKIDRVSKNDLSLLETCKASYQTQAW